MNAAQAALGYGKGELALPADAPHLDSEQQRLTRWLEEFLARPGNGVPRPPARALELIAASREPSARTDALAALLEREPLLSGRVLRLANSTLYAPSTPCVTVKQALSRMGLAMVRDVVMEAAMQMTVLHADGFNATLETIRRHSSAIAWISRFVARNTPIEAEDAFMFGLLHDVGLSVSLIGISEYLKREHQPLRLTPEAWLVADTMHERFSGTLLEAWGLPRAMTLVARRHHSLTLNGVAHPQVAVLMVAEQIAVSAGWDIKPQLELTPGVALAARGPERVSMEQTERALQALALTPRHFETISADTKRVLETLAGQFRHTAPHAPHARDSQPAR